MNGWFMMKSTARKSLASIVALAAMIVTASVGPWPHDHLQAQDPPPPNNFMCVGLFAGCPDCNAVYPPLRGCTAPPPKFWQVGVCRPWDRANCTQWNGYNCGVEITCGDFRPTGNLCWQNTSLCR